MLYHLSWIESKYPISYLQKYEEIVTSLPHHVNCKTIYLQKGSSGDVLWKKVFLNLSQNPQENTCARVSLLIKLQAWGLQIY